MPIADAVVPNAKSAAVGSLNVAFGLIPPQELEATASVGALDVADVRPMQVDEFVLGMAVAGDAKAIGHPVCASGARALTMLLLEMARRSAEQDRSFRRKRAVHPIQPQIFAIAIESRCVSAVQRGEHPRHLLPGSS